MVVKAVDEFLDENYRSFAISLLVPTVIRGGAATYLMGDVLNLVGRVQKRGVRASLLGDCGLRLAAVGKVAEAEEVFRRALENLKEAGEDAGQDFTKIAVRMAEAAVTSGQRRFIDMIFEGLPYADAFSRAVAVGAVAVGLCALRSEEFEGALSMLLDVIKMLAVPSKCVKVLVEVAWWLARMGVYEKGRMLLEEAHEWARRGARDERDKLLMKVAREFLRVAEAVGSADDVEKAFMVASEVEDIYGRAWVESDAVKVFVRLRGDGRGERIDRARIMAGKIAEKTVRAWTMRDIAVSLFENGLAEDAVKVLREAAEVARSIFSDRDRLPVLKDIAVDLARIGEETGNEKLIEEALKLSEEVKGDARYYSFTLHKIAVEVLRVKGVSSEQLMRAVKILDMMEPSFQELAVCDVLKLIEEEGGEWLNEALNAVLKWAESVKDPFYRACIKERVAESLLKTGRVDEAAALLRGVREEAEGLEEPMRSSLIGGCSVILARMAAAGRGEFWSDALACLEKHADTSRKLDYAIQIVGAMFESGEEGAASKLVDELEREVDALDKPVPKYLLGRELALMLLRAGFVLGRMDFVERAVNLVRCAEGVNKKAEFLQELLEGAIEAAGPV